MSARRLTKRAIADASKELAARDPVLRMVWKQFGAPPLLKRPATFGTFIHIILEQQVSVESARSTFDRLKNACKEDVTAETLISLGEDQLRNLGFSRQKTRYSIALAEDCLSGRFRPDRLSRMSDDEARAQIVDRLGLGDWSADVFLMMALLRPDILPVGDLALVKGMEGLDDSEYLTRESLMERAESWRPLRSVATRMVWQWYVHQRGRDIF